MLDRDHHRVIRALSPNSGRNKAPDMIRDHKISTHNLPELNSPPGEALVDLVGLGINSNPGHMECRFRPAGHAMLMMAWVILRGSVHRVPK